MVEISATIVKELREKSGAGMMDCKKALLEVGGNLEEAIDWLRKKGLAAAAKKAGRVAAEGLIGVLSKGNHAAIVEINAETDFVARNPQFQNLVNQITLLASTKDCTTEEILSMPMENSTVQEVITNLVAVIGENMQLRRHQYLQVNEGVVASYVHNAIVPNLGKIGVLVALESKANQDVLLDLGKKLAMHVAATSPLALDISSVAPELLEREKAILTEQAKASGRPDDVIQKMIEGRIRKYYEEIVLLEQIFVIDGKTKVSQFIEQTAQSAGHPIQLKAFVRFALGEGIEKVESNFAEEVMAQANLAK